MSQELRANLGLPLTVRTEEEAAAPVVMEGYAALYGARTVIWGMFEEEIVPGFFTPAIRDAHDCRALFNHDANFPLGRTKSGTLKLREDEKGLWTETRPPTTAIASSIVELVRRGDVDGMSFAFTIHRQEWLFAAEGSGEMDLRRLIEIEKLYDVGPVTYPAYEQTSIKIREQDKKMYEEARARWQERNRKIQVAVPDSVFSGTLCEARSAEGLWIAEDLVKREDEAKDEQEKTTEESVPETTPSPEGGETVAQGQVESEAPGGDAACAPDSEEKSAGTRDPSAVIREISRGQAKWRFYDRSRGA